MPNATVAHARDRRRWWFFGVLLAVGSLAVGSEATVWAQDGAPPVRSNADPSRAASTSEVERCIARGKRLLEAGNPGSGLSWLRRGIALSPRSLPARVALIEGLVGTGREEEADAMLRQALALDARSPALLRLRVRLRQGSERLGALRALLMVDSSDEEAWRERAEVAAELGAWNEALACRRRLLEFALSRGEIGDAEQRWIDALKLLALHP